MRALSAICVAMLLSGCGDDAPLKSSGPGAGGGGGAGGAAGCAPGERPLEEGGCQPAGVPADGCGVGFEPNDVGGCDAVMPEQPCGAGLFALPGETTCHEVAPCGTGQWADDLPDEPGTQFVDAAFAGTSDGSELAPWKTIQEGVDAAAPGALVAIAAGAYPRTVIAGKAVRLWGKCPGEVVLSGTAVFQGIVELQEGSDGSLVRGLGMTGPGFGVYVSGAQDTKVERVWIHDTTAYGVYADEGDAVASVSVSGSLIEKATIGGVFLEGATATFADTAVTGTRDSGGEFGTGMLVLKHRKSGAAAGVTIDHCVFEKNHTGAIQVAGAQAEVDSTLVRDTLPRPASSTSGDGFEIVGDPDWHERSTAVIRRSVIERNHDTGIFVAGSDVTIEATVVRETKPRELDGLTGRGVELVSDDAGRAKLTLRSSLVHGNHEMGVIATSSDVVVESSIVLETQPAGATQDSGIGVQVQKGSGERASGAIRWSVVRSNHELGVSVIGSDSEIVGSVIDGTRPRVSDGAWGRGIQFQLDLDDNDRAIGSISSTLVADNFEGGLMVFGAEVDLDASWIRDTRARESNQEYGDGAVVAGLYSPNYHGDGMLRVTNTVIEGNARAGIASFSGGVNVSNTTLLCNPIALDKEDFLGAPANFEDLGGNVCGCDGTTEPCKVLSSNLTAPDLP